MDEQPKWGGAARIIAVTAVLWGLTGSASLPTDAGAPPQQQRDANGQEVDAQQGDAAAQRVALVRPQFR